MGDRSESGSSFQRRRPVARGDSGGRGAGRGDRPRPSRSDRRVVRGRAEPRARAGATRARDQFRIE